MATKIISSKNDSTMVAQRINVSPNYFRIVKVDFRHGPPAQSIRAKIMKKIGVESCYRGGVH